MKMNDKTKVKRCNKCTNAHTMLQENLKKVRVCVKNTINIFKYSLKWKDSTKHIKGQMDSIETHILLMDT